MNIHDKRKRSNELRSLPSLTGEQSSEVIALDTAILDFEERWERIEKMVRAVIPALANSDLRAVDIAKSLVDDLDAARKTEENE